MLNFVSGQRWLGLRIEILGSIVVLVSSILVISLNDDLKIEPGLGKSCTAVSYLNFPSPYLPRSWPFNFVEWQLHYHLGICRG